MSKNQSRSKAKKNLKWEQENETIQSIRSNAAAMKRHLRTHGCDLPFYDYMDSYVEEFERTVEQAKATHPSLLGVHELDDAMYRETDYGALGYGDYEQIFFDTGTPVTDYGQHKSEANLCGHTAGFFDRDGNLRTVIVIRRKVKEFEHRELKYALKIAALWHEIGHVHDMECSINFDVSARTVNIVEAEIFANLFALEKMVERSLVQSHDLLADGLRKVVGADGYLGEVGRGVIDRLPKRSLIRWTEFPLPAGKGSKPKR